jgi:hypothetical protein
MSLPPINNNRFADHGGNGSPDSVYLLTLWRPGTSVTLTTCNDYTDFPTRLLLLDGVPSDPNTKLLASSDDQHNNNDEGGGGRTQGSSPSSSSSLSSSSSSSSPALFHHWTGLNQGFSTPSQAPSCSSLFATVVEPATLYVLVEGQSEDDQGVFEVSVVCDAGHDPTLEEMCMYSYFSCGESVKGSTFDDQVPTLFGGGGTTGDRVYLLAVDGPTEVMLSTCNEYSTIDTVVFVFDGPPTLYDYRVSNNPTTRLLGSSSSSGSSCGAVLVTLPHEGAFYVVVRGLSSSLDRGLFELTSQCVPRPTPLSDCGYSYIGCGDLVSGSTVGHPSFLDTTPFHANHQSSSESSSSSGSGQPDALFLVTVFDPVTVAVTSCKDSGKVRARMALFGSDATPHSPNATLLARSSATGNGGRYRGKADTRGKEWGSSSSSSSFLSQLNGGGGISYGGGGGGGGPTGEGECTLLTYDLTVPGGYWLVVEGDDDSATNRLSGGLFDLQVGCNPLPVSSPNETCKYHWATCGDTLRGTTKGFPDRFGGKKKSPPVVKRYDDEEGYDQYQDEDEDDERVNGGSQTSDGRPEQVYLVAVEEPLRMSLSTCAHEASSKAFPLRFMVFNGPPHHRDSVLLADSEPHNNHNRGGDNDHHLPYGGGGGSSGGEALRSRKKKGGEGCTTLDVLLTGPPHSYYVVVEGALAPSSSAQQQKSELGGYFEFTIGCDVVPIVTDPEDACGYAYVACGDRVLGSTVGFPSFLDNGGGGGSGSEGVDDYDGGDGSSSAHGTLQPAGERVYLLTVDSATTVSASTCGSDPMLTTFKPKLSIFDGPPGDGRTYSSSSANTSATSSHPRAHRPFSGGGGNNDVKSVKLADSSASRGEQCALLVVDLPTAGAYYLVVDGDDDDDYALAHVDNDFDFGFNSEKMEMEKKNKREGTFELSIGCQALPIVGLDDTCGSSSVATCGDLLMGTTRGFPSFITSWSNSPDHMYQLAVDRPTGLSLSTCGSKLINFNAMLLVYSGNPMGAAAAVEDDDDRSGFDSNNDSPPVLIADSMGSTLEGGCVTVVAELLKEGSYWVVVSGLTEEDQGEYEVSVGCTDLLASSAAIKPTLDEVVTSVVSVTANDDEDNGNTTTTTTTTTIVSHPQIECGSEVIGTASEAPFYLFLQHDDDDAVNLSNSSSASSSSSSSLSTADPSRVYMLELLAPTTVSASTCDATNHQHVSQSNVEMLTTAAGGSFGCGTRVSLYRLDDDVSIGDVDGDGSSSSEDRRIFPSELLFTSPLPDNSASSSYVPRTAAIDHIGAQRFSKQLNGLRPNTAAAPFRHGNVNLSNESSSSSFASSSLFGITLANLLVASDNGNHHDDLSSSSFSSTGLDYSLNGKGCATLSASVDTGRYALVVTPSDPDSLFKLRVNCAGPPSLATTNTLGKGRGGGGVAGSSADLQEEEEGQVGSGVCGDSALTCGESVVGSTQHLSSDWLFHFGLWI